MAIQGIQVHQGIRGTAGCRDTLDIVRLVQALQGTLGFAGYQGILGIAVLVGTQDFAGYLVTPDLVVRTQGLPVILVFVDCQVTVVTQDRQVTRGIVDLAATLGSAGCQGIPGSLELTLAHRDIQVFAGYLGTPVSAG